MIFLHILMLLVGFAALMKGTVTLSLYAADVAYAILR